METEIKTPVENAAMIQVKTDTRAVCENALSLIVNTPEANNSAAEMRVLIKRARKKITETFAETIDKAAAVKRAATEAKKAADNLLARALEPFQLADEHLKNQSIAYSDAQEKIKREKELKSAIKAENDAQKIRDKLKADALKAKEKAAELAEAGKPEQAEALREMSEERLEEAGQVYAEPVAVENTAAQITKPKIGGATYKTSLWQCIPPASPKDKREAIKAVNEGVLPLSIITFNAKAMKDWARLAEKTGRVHGFVIIKKTNEAVRG